MIGPRLMVGRLVCVLGGEIICSEGLAGKILTRRIICDEGLAGQVLAGELVCDKGLRTCRWISALRGCVIRTVQSRRHTGNRPAQNRTRHHGDERQDEFLRFYHWLVFAGTFLFTSGKEFVAGALVLTSGKLLVAGALVFMSGRLLVAGALVVPPASVVLELVDCVSVEVLGLF